jgi:hypothetical protein
MYIYLERDREKSTNEEWTEGRRERERGERMGEREREIVIIEATVI